MRYMPKLSKCMYMTEYLVLGIQGGTKFRGWLKGMQRFLRTIKNNISCSNAYALYAKTIKLYDRISSSRNSVGGRIQRLVKRKAEFMRTIKTMFLVIDKEKI